MHFLFNMGEKSQVCTNLFKQVKPGFTNYQPQPKYSWAISKIEGKPKGKVGKTKTSERDLKNYRRLTEFGQG